MAKPKKMLNFNEYLEHWAHREFNKKYAQRVYEDMVDYMAGNRPGSKFEIDAGKRIKAAYAKYVRTEKLK